MGAALAIFLVLSVPFVIYVTQQGYGIARPEILIVLGALAVLAFLAGGAIAVWPVLGVVALAGGLTFFADIQIQEPGLKRLALLFLVLCGVVWILRRHAATLVSLMMITVLVLSSAAHRREAIAGPPAAAPRADLPLFVHLVLDEHLGLSAFPMTPLGESTVAATEAFFAARRFRVFAGAYSQFDTTLPSLSHLLNLAPDTVDEQLTVPGSRDGRYRLQRSEYFAGLAEMGYAVAVHQPDYLDLCAEPVSRTACHTYDVRSLRALDHLAIPAWQKLPVVGGTYLNRSDVHGRVKSRYRDLRRRLASSNISLPPWNWERGAATAVGTLAMLARLESDVQAADRGDFIFAHLLLPHYPYTFDAGCQPRPPVAWRMRRDTDRTDVLNGINNTDESRAELYALYAEQLACLQHRLGQLLDAIPEPLRRDAIIVIQGDHGSRISRVEADRGNVDRLGLSDYADHFSTLFAVRAPAIAPGTDPRVAPVTCLLRGLVQSGFRDPVDMAGCPSRPAVFLRQPFGPPERRELPHAWLAADGARSPDS